MQHYNYITRFCKHSKSSQDTFMFNIDKLFKRAHSYRAHYKSFQQSRAVVAYFLTFDIRLYPQNIAGVWSRSLRQRLI